VCGCPCRLLYDPDFTDNESATLASLNLASDSLLRLDDDTQEIKLQLRLIDRCAACREATRGQMALRQERPPRPVALPHSVDFADASALFELNRAEAAAAAAAAAASAPVAGQKRKADDDAARPAPSGPVTVDDEDDLVILDAAPDPATAKRARTE